MLVEQLDGGQHPVPDGSSPHRPSPEKQLTGI